jgi:hypothetical protein
MTKRRVTNEGRNAVRDFLIGNLSEVAVGTGSSDPKGTDTGLDSEVYRGGSSNGSDGTGDMISKLRLGVDDASEETLSELMLFFEDSGFARLTFSETFKEPNTEIEFETTVRSENV